MKMFLIMMDWNYSRVKLHWYMKYIGILITLTLKYYL